MSRYPAPAPVSLAPAAQLLLPGSPGLSLARRSTLAAPPLPQVPLCAAAARGSFSRGGLTSSLQQSGLQVPAEGGRWGNQGTVRAPCSASVADKSSWEGEPRRVAPTSP